MFITIIINTHFYLFLKNFFCFLLHPHTVNNLSQSWPFVIVSKILVEIINYCWCCTSMVFHFFSLVWICFKIHKFVKINKKKKENCWKFIFITRENSFQLLITIKWGSASGKAKAYNEVSIEQTFRIVYCGPCLDSIEFVDKIFR